MFDGNHRPRRDVNLSGRRRPRATVAAGKSNFLATSSNDTKSQVLEQSRLQREERRFFQLQQASAGKIQKVTRGWLTRRSLVRTWLEVHAEANDPASRMSLLRLSMALSLKSGHYIGSALLRLGENISRIQPGSITSVSKQRILRRALLDLSDDNDIMSNLCRYLIEEDRNPVRMDTYVVLIETCQRWMCIKHDHAVTQSLWRWSCQVAATNQDAVSLAYLASTHFGYAGSQYQSVAAAYFGADDTHRWNYQTLLGSLVDVLGRNTQALLHHMLQDKEAKIVCRVMELYQSLASPNPHIMLQLVELLLLKQSHATILTSLKIRGEDVRSIVLDGRQVEELKDIVDDEEDEDEREADDATVKASAAALKKQRHRHSASAATRLTRQQVQTIPRLNQLYQDDLSRLRRETLTYFAGQELVHRTNAVELAEHLGNANLWQQWGLAVLGQESSASRVAYLRLLGRLLQGCSGFKTSTTSPFLSQLAYSKPFLEALWRQTLVLMMNGTEDEEVMFLCTTLFCDIFAHHLISVSDKDFLQDYTTENSNPTILAEHVVRNLKTVLYDLNWNKPVVASDVRVAEEVQCHRARLLLSATKTWNSLYERWSRLVHQAPFCDESTWWFPRLASRDDDAAVISSRVNPDGAEEDEEDGMDVDDSDDEDEINVNEVENDALADTFRDPKMARVLTSIPQAIPFDRRVKLFNSLLNADKLKTQDESVDFRRAVARMMQRGDNNDDMMDMMGGRERVEIHRDHMYADSMEQLNTLGRRLKSKIQVTMINKHGAREAGIDGGGVFKEFLDDLIKEAFHSDVQAEVPLLFAETPMHTLAVNVDLLPEKDTLSHYEFLGRVLGKSVYESILVEPQFCLPFLNQLLGKQNTLEDLKNFDLEFYNNLMKLRTLSESEILGMGLTFELNVSVSRSVPLIPNGSQIQVTKQNVFHYIHLVAHQRLNVEGAAQTRSFLRGFRDLIPASWVRLFSAYELQKMISGDDSVRGIDVSNLKEAMQYAGGYHPSQPIITWFWEVIEDLLPDQQRQFLRFMTSCSRQPLLGFRALEPLPCIQQIRVPEGTPSNSVPLPTSSTCMNLLKLPNYGDKALLRMKLIAAIEAGAGFELT